MPQDNIKDSEQDRSPPGEARNQMNMRERIKSLFHKRGTKRNPKLNDDLDSSSVRSGWSDSTLVDTSDHSSSSGQNRRRLRRQASRNRHRNARDHPVDARSRSLAVTNRQDRPGSRYADQGRLHGQLGSSGAQAEPRPNEQHRGKTARSMRTNDSTSESHRSQGSFLDEPYPSSISDPNRLKALTPMPRLYDMDGVYDLDERYGREIWYESDGCHDSEDGFDSDDGYEGDDYDIDSRTIRRSGQMSWSFRGSVQFQIN